MTQHPSKIRVWEPVLLFILFVVAAVYAIMALNSHDWLWFRSRTTQIEPSRIVLVQDGERTTLVPGHPEFAQLSAAAAESLAEVANTDLISVGLSEQTLDDYAEQGVLMELYFQRPVTFHTRFRAGEPTQILVPLEGRHAGSGYFFRGAQGEWWFGAIRMANPAPLYNAVAALGYPVAVRAPASN